jgi:Anti-sigma factor NepR
VRERLVIEHIGAKLRRLYSRDVDEPFPQSLYDLLNQLDQHTSMIKPIRSAARPGTKREKC